MLHRRPHREQAEGPSVSGPVYCGGCLGRGATSSESCSASLRASARREEERSSQSLLFWVLGAARSQMLRTVQELSVWVSGQPFSVLTGHTEKGGPGDRGCQGYAEDKTIYTGHGSRQSWHGLPVGSSWEGVRAQPSASGQHHSGPTVSCVVLFSRS